MTKTLTPTEALQAIVDGKTVEVKFGEHYDWRVVKTNQMIIDELINPEHQFRLAQEKITIGDVSFPKPVSEPLEEGTEYWVADINNQYYAAHTPNRWVDDFIDKRHLRRGLIHLSREAAIAHVKALIQLNGGNVDE